MTWHPLRLLVSALVAIAMLAIAMLGVPWFDVSIADPVLSFVDVFRIDLRTVAVCGFGTCEPMSLRTLDGAYPLLAVGVFWTGAAVIAFVVVQAGMRLAVRRTFKPFTRLGYGAAIASFTVAALAAYVFTPASSSFGDGSLVVHITGAPVLMLLGNLAAIVALRESVVRPAAVLLAIGEPGRIPVTPITPHRMVAIEPPSKRPPSDTA